MNIAIIGAGLAGLACADRLRRAGHSTRIFDKGRVPGGRTSARMVDTDRGAVCFDHGAPYFTVRDPDFRAQVDRWARAGIVVPWPAAGDHAWVGRPLMNAPALALASGLDVRTSCRIEALRHDRTGWQLVAADGEVGPFDAAVLALPAEQARALVAPWDRAMATAAEIRTEPCWTVMAAFADRVPIAADVVRHRGVLDWAARNSAKPGRGGSECWVMHATAAWSSVHLEDPGERIGPALLAALASHASSGLPQSVFVAAHRWRYARSGRFGRPALWDRDLKIGLCGDWLLGPRVECAWLSGDRLAAEIGGG